MNPDQDRRDQKDRENGQKDRQPGFWEVAASVAAAAFGVRARKHQERDFSSRSATPFIIGGLLFTLLFIAGLAFIVHLVLRHYGA